MIPFIWYLVSIAWGAVILGLMVSATFIPRQNFWKKCHNFRTLVFYTTIFIFSTFFHILHNFIHHGQFKYACFYCCVALVKSWAKSPFVVSFNFEKPARCENLHLHPTTTSTTPYRKSPMSRPFWSKNAIFPAQYTLGVANRKPVSHSEKKYLGERHRGVYTEVL